MPFPHPSYLRSKLKLDVPIITLSYVDCRAIVEDPGFLSIIQYPDGLQEQALPGELGTFFGYWFEPLFRLVTKEPDER